MAQHSLLGQRRFSAIFWTQFLGAFNDNFLKNAMVILITYRGVSVMGIGAAELVAAAGGIFILPFFLFSALAGQIADKFEKGRVVRVIKFVEILIMLLASAGFLTEHYELLLAVLFLMGLHSTFFGPIKYSILPQHLSPDELVGGNALVEAGTFVAILIGTIGGGLMVAMENGTRYVSAGLVLFALAGYATSWFIPRAAAVDPALPLEFNPITPTWRIFHFAREVPSVFLSILGISWFWLFGAAVLSLFPILCKDVIGGDERLVSTFLAVFSIGIAIGSLLCEKFSRKRLELGLVPLGSIGITFFSAILGYLCHLVPPGQQGLSTGAFLNSKLGIAILGDLLLLSVFSGFLIVPLYTMMQQRSAPAHRSRVIAANNILNAFFMVLSSIALMLLLREHVSVAKIFLILAGMNAVVALYIYSLLPEFLIRFLIWVLSHVFYNPKVTGEDHVPDEGGAILICNHVSFIDWMIIAAAVRRPARFVMDHTFFRGFLVKMVLTQAKVIPIASAKEDPARLKDAFARIAEELRSGELVCIFPEGRITKDGKLSEFKPGVLQMLKAVPVPVVPMALVGLWGSFFSRKYGAAMSKWPKRFRIPVELRIGAPIPAEGIRLELMKQKVEELRGKEEPV